MSAPDLMSKIMSLVKRRGFIFQGSEIYGGIGGIYDLGPLGVELATNIKTAWWKNIVREKDNIIGLDTSILMNRKVWEASGHTKGFADPLTECKNCHSRFREDILPKSKNCPTCGKNTWTKPRMFNLMFKTHIGPVADEASETFLRPETAQGIFINFKNIVDTMRVKLPFGIAQIGKGFRNEITIGNLLFRVREFEMMELEYFTYPEQAKNDFEYWQKERMNWYLALGLKKENLRFREHKETERAHYAVSSVDIEYNWPFMGWGELEGIANRTDYDLKAHSKKSGEDLSYFNKETKQRIIPYVIEPSAGVGRAILAFLIDAYTEEKAPSAEGGEEERVVLKLNPKLAPIQVAVLPLVKNRNEIVMEARKVFGILKPYFSVQYDEVDSIGRRYRRQDEIGTPFAITIDFETLEKDDVTVRDRDTMKQERIKIADLIKFLKEKLQ